VIPDTATVEVPFGSIVVAAEHDNTTL